VGDRLELSLELAVAGASHALEVIAAAPLLQASRGAVSFVADQKKVVTLPLDGRNFVPLIALSSGVNLPPGNLLPRINGSRPRVSEYIYDGISVLQPEPGQVAYYPVIDAIDEFRVETNSYSAEYGRSNGGVIMVNQKSGSNELHGALFEFFRNERRNARNLFATTGPKPRFRRNQYGFVLGGPVQRNRTFFFVDWQGTRAEYRRCADRHSAGFAAATRHLRSSRLRPVNNAPVGFRVCQGCIPEQYNPAEPVRPSCIGRGGSVPAT
jgi:hypothetical protein